MSCHRPFCSLRLPPRRSLRVAAFCGALPTSGGVLHDSTWVDDKRSRGARSVGLCDCPAAIQSDARGLRPSPSWRWPAHAAPSGTPGRPSFLGIKSVRALGITRCAQRCHREGDVAPSANPIHRTEKSEILQATRRRGDAIPLRADMVGGDLPIAVRARTAPV